MKLYCGSIQGRMLISRRLLDAGTWYLIVQKTGLFPSTIALNEVDQTVVSFF